MGRKLIPEQSELKTTIRHILMKRPYIILADIAHDTGIPYSTLYFWVNGKTWNMQTAAYLEALASWVEAHK